MWTWHGIINNQLTWRCLLACLLPFSLYMSTCVLLWHRWSFTWCHHKLTWRATVSECTGQETRQQHDLWCLTPPLGPPLPYQFLQMTVVVGVCGMHENETDLMTIVIMIMMTSFLQKADEGDLKERWSYWPLLLLLFVSSLTVSTELRLCIFSFVVHWGRS